MISEQMGHTIQNLPLANPCSQKHATRSTTRPARMANAASPAARQRPPALPVAAMTRVALMYPPMSRGISISDGTRPNGSLGGSCTGVYCWTVSFCPALLAAFSNCTAMSS